MSLVLRTQDVIELLRDKNPEKYKQLRQSKQLQEWAKLELENLNSSYNVILEMNPDLSPSAARELSLEAYDD
jgi:hypothetical protein